MSVYGGAAGQRLAGAVNGANQNDVSSGDSVALNRAMIGRYFRDLRAALRLSPDQASFRLQTHIDSIEALERGHVEALPPWPETVRIVMTYGTMAGIDGRPALALISELLSGLAQAPAAAQPDAAPAARTASKRENGKAGSRFKDAIARRISQGARPDRAFYAVSLPLGVLILALNTSAVNASLTTVSDFFRTHFAEVREGHRWIEVSDPRSRRGDKLRVGGG